MITTAPLTTTIEAARKIFEGIYYTDHTPAAVDGFSIIWVGGRIHTHEFSNMWAASDAVAFIQDNLTAVDFDKIEQIVMRYAFDGSKCIDAMTEGKRLQDMPAAVLNTYSAA